MAHEQIAATALLSDIEGEYAVSRARLDARERGTQLVMDTRIVKTEALVSTDRADVLDQGRLAVQSFSIKDFEVLRDIELRPTG